MNVRLILALFAALCIAEVFSKRAIVTSRNKGLGQQKLQRQDEVVEEQKYEGKDEEKDEAVLKGQYEQKKEETVNEEVYQQKEDKLEEEKQIGGGYEEQKEEKVVDVGPGHGQLKEEKYIPQKGGYGQSKETYITGGSHVVNKVVGGGYGHGYGGGYGYGYKKACPPGGLCKFDGELVPDTESCCKYYKCAHCKPFPMKCGPGTHYNPFLKVCDFPHKSGCVARDQKCGYYFAKW